MKAVFNTTTPLLELLQKRYSSLGLGEDKRYKRPRLSEREIFNAARDWAEVHKSDPFARARMELHLRNGYVMLSEVQGDVRRYRQARQHALPIAEAAE